MPQQRKPRKTLAEIPKPMVHDDKDSKPEQLNSDPDPEWDELFRRIAAKTPGERARLIVGLFAATDRHTENTLASVREWLAGPANRKDKYEAIRGNAILEEMFQEALIYQRCKTLWTELYGWDESMDEEICMF